MNERFPLQKDYDHRQHIVFMIDVLKPLVHGAWLKGMTRLSPNYVNLFDAVYERKGCGETF